MTATAADRAVVHLLRGLGDDAASEVLALLEGRFGPVLLDGFDPASDEQVIVRAMYLRGRSSTDPQASLPSVDAWIAPLLAGEPANRRSRRLGLLACGAAYFRAGRFESAVTCQSTAVEVSETEPGRRAARLELSRSLRRGGRAAEALELATQVAAARHLEYPDKSDAAVLEAETEELAALVALGQPVLRRCRDLRQRRVDRAGFLGWGSTEAFVLSARCWMALGQLTAAFSCATVAQLIRERYPLPRETRVDVDRLLAETHRQLSTAGPTVDHSLHHSQAERHATAALEELRFAYGPHHPSTHEAADLARWREPFG